MPASIVIKYADIYDVSVEEAEAVWDEAKEITRKKFNLPKNEDKWEDKHWAYTTGVFKKMMKNEYGTPATEDRKKIKENRR